MSWLPHLLELSGGSSYIESGPEVYLWKTLGKVWLFLLEVEGVVWDLEDFKIQVRHPLPPLPPSPPLRTGHPGHSQFLGRLLGLLVMDSPLSSGPADHSVGVVAPPSGLSYINGSYSMALDLCQTVSLWCLMTVGPCGVVFLWPVVVCYLLK